MIQKPKVYVMAVCALITGSFSAMGQNQWYGFNNAGPFIAGGFTFFNEQGEMDVLYRTSDFIVNSGRANLRSGRTDSDTAAHGAWVRTNRDIVPLGSVIRGKCRTAVFNSDANWSAFWTLHDNVINTGDSWRYYENDIMETEPRGNYYNRYTRKSPTGGPGFGPRPGEQQLITGANVRAWRNTYRIYRCDMQRSSSSFSVSGPNSASRTINGVPRGFTSQIMLTNRPWASALVNLPNGQRIADLQVDWIQVLAP